MLVSRIPLELGATAKAFPSRFFGTLFFLMRNSRLAGSCISMFIPISDPSTHQPYGHVSFERVWRCTAAGVFRWADGGEPKFFALHHGFVPRAGDALSTFFTNYDGGHEKSTTTKILAVPPPKNDRSIFGMYPNDWSLKKICFMFGDSKCFVKPCQMNFWGSLLFTHPTWCCEGNHPVDDIL